MPRPSLEVLHIVQPVIVEHDVWVWTALNMCLLKVMIEARNDSKIRGQVVQVARVELSC